MIRAERVLIAKDKRRLNSGRCVARLNRDMKRDRSERKFVYQRSSKAEKFCQSRTRPTPEWCVLSEASLPLIRALLDAWMSQGAARAFMIAGARTSIGAGAGALTIACWRVVALLVLRSGHLQRWQEQAITMSCDG